MTSDPGSRRARREAQRAEARRAAGRTTPASRWLLPGLIAAAVVVAAVLAIVLSGGGQPSGGGSSSVPPSIAGGSPAPGSAGAVPAPVIDGSPLPAFPGPGTTDPAVGQPAPEVTGTDFDGAAGRDRGRRASEGPHLPRALVPALPGRGAGRAGVGDRGRRARPASTSSLSRPPSTRPARTIRRMPGCSEKAGLRPSSPIRPTASPRRTV